MKHVGGGGEGGREKEGRLFVLLCLTVVEPAPLASGEQCDSGTE